MLISTQMEDTMPRTNICSGRGNVYIAATTGIHTIQFATRFGMTTRLTKPPQKKNCVTNRR